MFNLFLFDPVGFLLLGLILFVGINVAVFAKRYLEGDQRYWPFFKTFGLMLLSLTLLVFADHLLLFWVAWGLSNALLVRLMVHKVSWRQAVATGRLAAYHFLFGQVALGAAFFLLYYLTGLTSIQALGQRGAHFIPLFLLLIAALTQSSVWPFHRWLLSSLNAPTPVSAIMHAGLVNGGGFLLIRFAPLLVQMPPLLMLLFWLGLLSALLGTLWKLMQPDIKRMLASSTMGQMGFMLAQCGLGLFAAAAAHLCFHAVFKAYLFLASGSAVQERRTAVPKQRPILGLLIGLVALPAFSLSWDTTLVIAFMVWILAAQIIQPVIAKLSFKRLLLALVLAASTGFVYVLNVHLIEQFIPIQRAQPLGIGYGLGMVLLFVAWLAPNWAVFLGKWRQPLYVRMLNASQPHASTVTAHRNDYQSQEQTGEVSA